MTTTALAQVAGHLRWTDVITLTDSMTHMRSPDVTREEAIYNAVYRFFLIALP